MACAPSGSGLSLFSLASCCSHALSWRLVGMPTHPLPLLSGVLPCTQGTSKKIWTNIQRLIVLEAHLPTAMRARVMGFDSTSPSEVKVPCA
jgi:hypothetical protein